MNKSKAAVKTPLKKKVLFIILPFILTILWTLSENYTKEYAYDIELSHADDEINKAGSSRRQTILVDQQHSNEKLHAWLYLPNSLKTPPLVIMGGGLGAQKDFGLEKYGDFFASEGIATLIFDYRSFGGTKSTEKRIRNHIDPTKHSEDYQAVLSKVRAGLLGSKVDSSKICLLGTSFSGGHVLTVGSSQEGKNLKCIISQVPHLGKTCNIYMYFYSFYLISFNLN